jgi:hypothetical protein
MLPENTQAWVIVNLQNSLTRLLKRLKFTAIFISLILMEQIEAGIILNM